MHARPAVGEWETWKPSLVGDGDAPRRSKMKVWLVHHDVLLPLRESAAGEVSDLWTLLQGIKETVGQSQTAISSFIPQEPPLIRPEAHNLRGGTFQVFNGLQRALAGSSGHQGVLLVADPALGGRQRGPQRHSPRCGRSAHCHFHVIHSLERPFATLTCWLPHFLNGSFVPAPPPLSPHTSFEPTLRSFSRLDQSPCLFPACLVFFFFFSFPPFLAAVPVPILPTQVPTTPRLRTAAVRTRVLILLLPL
jgi:hypothetical protein